MAVLGLAALEAGADVVVPIAIGNSTAAPGAGGGTFLNLINDPIIDVNGFVGFQSSLTGTSDASTVGMFRWDPANGIGAVMREKQPAPGAGGGTLSNPMFTPAINDSGVVLGFSGVVGSSNGSTFGFFRGDSVGPLSEVMRDGQAAPGTGGGTFTGINAWDFSTTAGVPMLLSIGGSSNGSSSGMFLVGNGPATLIARLLGAAPGTGGGTFSGFSNPTANANNQQAFVASLTGTSNGSTQGLFRNDTGTLRNLVRNNQAAPGGGTFSSLANIVNMNTSGQVAFSASMTGSADGATNGIFRVNAIGAATPTITTIARHLQTAPGLGGGAFGTNGFQTLVNSPGQVAFMWNVIGATTGDGLGIFKGDGIDLVAVARLGMSVPNGGRISSFPSTSMSFNAAGDVLFEADLTATPAGTADNRGLYLADGQEIIEVARKGQALGGSTANDFSINPFAHANGFRSVNDNGQVSFQALLANGTTGIFRYTPSLHWRQPFSGNWDTGNNWTLGIAPASVHEVFIDPQFGVNVSGPAANVSVAALTVAGKSGTAFLDLNGGGQLQVNGATTIKSTGSINVSSGRLIGGAILNDGTLSVAVGGQLSISSLTNNNNISLSGPSTIGGQTINNGSMSVSHTTLGGGQLTNNVQLFLDAATVTNAIVNEVGGSMTARGTINNILTNRGTLTASGLLMVGAVNNSGLINVNAGSSIAQGGITNTGIITLAGGGLTAPVTNNGGGILQGGGGITTTVINNSGGLIFANSPLYPLTIASVSTNQPGARLRVADGSTLNIGTSFSNGGVITLGGNEANLNVGANITLSNSPSGIISGAGTITANVNNSGTVRAEGGQLMITGPASSNQSSGLMQVSEDATMLFAQGMSNSGTINVTGGSWINNTSTTFSNNGKISGYGTFTSPNITNNGTMTFTGGFTTINGIITNGATRKIEVANNPALFTGNVTNFGIFKNTKTSITFASTYTENGTFISDPADNFFSSVNVGESGAWVGGVGDRFFLMGDLLSASKNKSGWQTAEAELHFMGGLRHQLSVSGEDRGISFDGYSDNFAWGDLVIDAGDSLALADADQTAGGGLYVRRLLLGGGPGQISSIQGNGLNIYYDLGDSANAYLGGQTYALAGGGSISPVPEPATMLLAVAAMTGLFTRPQPRRRHRG